MASAMSSKKVSYGFGESYLCEDRKGQYHCLPGDQVAIAIARGVIRRKIHPDAVCMHANTIKTSFLDIICSCLHQQAKWKRARSEGGKKKLGKKPKLAKIEALIINTQNYARLARERVYG